MNNALRALLTLTITLLFFISCEDKPLPFEPKNNTGENNFLSTQKLADVADDALEAIEEAQAKIDEATEKADQETANFDLTTVYDKIAEAEAKLQEAQDAYDNGDYEDAIDLAKEAEELAEEAIELLEAILDADEDVSDEDDDSGNEKITICHKGHSITISINALQAHLNHGDYIGECGD